MYIYIYIIHTHTYIAYVPPSWIKLFRGSAVCGNSGAVIRGNSTVIQLLRKSRNWAVRAGIGL